MAVVGFATLFAGVINGYVAAAATGALLTFVLSVTLPAPNSAIPERLEGWGLAAGAAICALMLLWPPRQRADFRRRAAGRFVPLPTTSTRTRSLGPDVHASRARRSTLWGGVSWGPSTVRPARPVRWPRSPRFPTSSTGFSRLSHAIRNPRCSSSWPARKTPKRWWPPRVLLRASAERLEGRDGQPDFERLEEAREAVARALMRRLPELPSDIPAGEVPRALDAPFRIRALTYAARQAAAYGLLASGVEVPELDRVDIARPRQARAAIEATERLTIEHASVRSVWFRNSLRGAVGLSLAVYVAQRTGLQHGFWVVLGTLSVLRSNALGTGRSIVSALAGTAVGIVLGAAARDRHRHRTRRCSGACFRSRSSSPPTRRGRSRSPQARPGSRSSSSCSSTSSSRSAGGWAGSGRGRRDRLRDQPPGRPAVLAPRRRRASTQRARDRIRAWRGLRSRNGAAAQRWRKCRRGRPRRRCSPPSPRRCVSAIPRRALRHGIQRRGCRSARRRRGARPPRRPIARSTRTCDRPEHAGRPLRPQPRRRSSRPCKRGTPPSDPRSSSDARCRHPTSATARPAGRLLACVRAAASGRDKPTVDAALFLLWSSQHLDNLWRLEAHLAERVNAARATATAAE